MKEKVKRKKGKGGGILLLACALFTFSIFLFPFSLGAASQTISAIRVHLSENAAKATDELVRDVLPFKEGDTYSSEKLNESLDALRKWSVFDKIEASTNDTPQGVEVDYYLQEAVLIGEINIDGNYPYIEQKVKKYVSIRAGDVYTPERAEEQVRRIKEFYDREGYFNTQVSASEEWIESTNDVNVTFKIKRGQILRYRDINITGMHAYPKGRLTSAINTLRPYHPRRLADALRKVTSFYHYHGYPKAKIELVEKRPYYDTGDIDIDIKVVEGTKVDIVFKGNRGLSTAKIRKAVTIFEEGSFDDYEVDSSCESIAKLYTANGYPDTKVSSGRSVLSNGTVRIEFDIKEGEKQRIETIEFKGNEAIGERKLRKEMLTKELSLGNKGIYDPKFVAEDVDMLKKFYSSKGYENAHIGEVQIQDNQGRLTLTIPITENDQTIIKDVIFSGNEHFDDVRLLKQLKNHAGRPLDVTALDADKQMLIMFYADNGYPYATVEQTLEGNKIDYKITEGQLVKIGQVLVIGNSLTTTKAIRKTVGIRTGEPFNFRKIADAQIALRRIGTFATASIETIGLSEKENVVHLRVKVEEQKPFVADFSVAYSTDLKWSGTMNFTNLNTFGLAKITNFRLTGGKMLSKGEVNYTDPRFLGTDLQLSTSAWLLYQDNVVYTYAQGGGGFSFFRRFHRTGFMIKYELDRNYLVKGDSTAADADSLRDSTMSQVGLSASFDTRNNFSDPTKGVFAMANANFYDEIKGNNANFVKLGAFFGQYNGFLRYLGFTNQFRFDTIETYTRNVSIPSNNLLLLGGDNTLRGFHNDSLGPVNAAGNPTGGRLRWIYNAELHIKMPRNFQVAGFFDIGALTNDFGEINWYNIRRSAGFGLRYLTPVGPIRLDYGIILDRHPGDNFGRVHFTFGYVF